MEKMELLRKLEGMFDTAARTGEWGSIEIEIRYGKPSVLRRTTTEKIEESTGGNPRATKTYR